MNLFSPVTAIFILVQNSTKTNETTQFKAAKGDFYGQKLHFLIHNLSIEESAFEY